MLRSRMLLSHAPSAAYYSFHQIYNHNSSSYRTFFHDHKRPTASIPSPSDTPVNLVHYHEPKLKPSRSTDCFSKTHGPTFKTSTCRANKQAPSLHLPLPPWTKHHSRARASRPISVRNPSQSVEVKCAQIVCGQRKQTNPPQDCGVNGLNYADDVRCSGTSGRDIGGSIIERRRGGCTRGTAARALRGRTAGNYARVWYAGAWVGGWVSEAMGWWVFWFGRNRWSHCFWEEARVFGLFGECVGGFAFDLCVMVDWGFGFARSFMIRCISPPPPKLTWFKFSLYVISLKCGVWA